MCNSEQSDTTKDPRTGPHLVSRSFVPFLVDKCGEDSRGNHLRFAEVLTLVVSWEYREA